MLRKKLDQSLAILVLAKTDPQSVVIGEATVDMLIEVLEELKPLADGIPASLSALEGGDNIVTFPTIARNDTGGDAA